MTKTLAGEFAAQGVRVNAIAPGVVRTERSLRTQAAVLLAVLLAMLWLRPEPIWWALVALASAGVLAAELLNTALEQLADRLHPELHEQVRIAKDCAAGGVLLASLGAVAVAVALMVHLLGKP